MVRVFLSHSSRDKNLVRDLAVRLQKVGATVWLDEAELQVGDSLTERIRSGVVDSDFVVVSISRNSINSRWVLTELGTAIENGRATGKNAVLPIVLDDSPLPDSIKDSVIYGDFRDPNNFEPSLRELLVSLRLLSPQEKHALPARTQNVFGYLDKMNDPRHRMIADPHVQANRYATNPSSWLATQKVLIYWHSIGLTQADSQRMQADLTELGIESVLTMHNDPALPPDAVFIGLKTLPHVFTHVLRRLPYVPTHIFPFYYPSRAAGVNSGFTMSVGLRATFHTDQGVAWAAKLLAKADFDRLCDLTLSPEERTALFERIAG